MRIVFLAVSCLLLVISSAVSAETVTTLTSSTGGATQLQSNVGGMSIGFIKVGSKEVTNLAWHPDFKLGPWGLGADINYAIGAEKPSGYENIVLRYVEYDDSKKGLRLGVIDNLTWGHGLLMKDYSSCLAGPILLNNSQLDFRGYVDMDKYVVRALGTKTSLYGLRLEERINPMLTLGQTYITAPKISGIGVDASVPLPLNFEGYAEWAKLIDHGSGLSAGISWAYDMMVANASFLAEYRLLDKGFVPGYYNADYETNPINITSVEATGNAKNGYLAQLGINALGLAGLKVAYENYNDSSSAALNADLFAKLPQDVEVTGYYRQPNFVNFRSLTLEQGAMVGGSVSYPMNQYTRAILHYKKVYNPSTAQIEESEYLEIKLSF
jgi:hypothetical protein